MKILWNLSLELNLRWIYYLLNSILDQGHITHRLWHWLLVLSHLLLWFLYCFEGAMILAIWISNRVVLSIIHRINSHFIPRSIVTGNFCCVRLLIFRWNNLLISCTCILLFLSINRCVLTTGLSCLWNRIDFPHMNRCSPFHNISLIHSVKVHWVCYKVLRGTYNGTFHVYGVTSLIWLLNERSFSLIFIKLIWTTGQMNLVQMWQIFVVLILLLLNFLLLFVILRDRICHMCLNQRLIVGQSPTSFGHSLIFSNHFIPILSPLFPWCDITNLFWHDHI